MAVVTVYSDFGAPLNKNCYCFHCFPICFPWSNGNGSHDLQFLNVAFLNVSFFPLLFHLHQRLFGFSSVFVIRVSVVCISEFIGISPSSLDSSLCFIQPGISLDGTSLVAQCNEPACQYRRHKSFWFDPCVRKIPWGRKWQTIPLFLPGKSHGLEDPGGLQSMGSQSHMT